MSSKVETEVKDKDNENNKTGEWIKGTAPIVLDIDESCIVHARTTKEIDKKEVKSQVMDYKYIINKGPVKHKFTITAEDDDVASIKPEGEIEVNEGESITFNMIGSDGYRPTIDSIDNIKINAYGVSSYVFEDVNANHIISITNSSTTEESSIVTPHAYKGGRILPSAVTRIKLNTPTTFTIKPDEGYEIDKVLIDGHNVGAVSEYTFTFTELEFHLIEAFFKEAAPVTTYTVTSEGGSEIEGKIDPSGETTVNEGESYTLIISPNEGYVIHKVKDNNIDVTSELTEKGDSYLYTIKSVNEDHTITVKFADKPVTTYTVTSSCNEGGTIDPSGETVVNEGESYTLNIVTVEGYSFSVMDNDVDVNSHVQAGGKVGQFLYVIESVNEDHTIVVAFKSK